MNPDPQRRPLVFDRLDAAIKFLRTPPADTDALLERIRQLGVPDPVLREQIAIDRLRFRDAAAEPLTRTNPRWIPGEGERASCFVETFYLPSGRLFQIRRRYPAADELDRALRGGSYDEPSLWIREIIMSDAAQTVSATVIDAATVLIR